MAGMIKLGPTVTEGSVWDEGGKTDIVQIFISHQQDSIKSLQFLYNSGSLSEVYGEPNGLKFNTIALERPFEFLTSISGKYSSGKVISIVFGTNKKKYGPFGKTGTDNSVGIEEFHYDFGPMCGDYQKCCFGGFHGSILNGKLSSIGVYVSPLKRVEPYRDHMDYLDDLKLDY